MSSQVASGAWGAASGDAGGAGAGLPNGGVAGEGAATLPWGVSGGDVALEALHPLVLATYFAAVVLVGALSPQPVLAALSLAGALSCSVACLGARETLRQLRWELPALALVCVANPLYSHSGATTLLVVGPLVVRAESLAYGACMGAMMVSSVVWLACAGRVLGPDRALELGGGAWPTVSLMLSMALQLVPQLLRRAREVRAVGRACTAATGCPAPSGDAIVTAGGARSGVAAPSRRHAGAAGPREGRAGRAARGARLSGVLLGWALEESVGRSDAMRARGWRAGARRTSWRRERLSTRDALAEVVLVALVGLCSLVAASACAAWRFYPTMPVLVAWWGYVPYAALMALPAVLAVVGRARWRRWEGAA